MIQNGWQGAISQYLRRGIPFHLCTARFATCASLLSYARTEGWQIKENLK